MKKQRSLRKDKDQGSEGQVDNMLPIMSLMLILIPFLVGNVAFVQLKSVSVSTPGVSDPADMTPDQKKEKAVMAKLDISPEKMTITLLDEDSGNTIQKYDLRNNLEGADQAKNAMANWKTEWAKLDSLLVSVGEDVPFKDLIGPLEKVKFPFGTKAINGKLPPKINIVILPKGAA